MIHVIAPIVVIAALVAIRLAVEAIRRWARPANVMEQLHQMSDVKIIAGGQTIQAHSCVLQSVSRDMKPSGLVVDTYIFKAMVARSNNRHEG